MVISLVLDFVFLLVAIKVLDDEVSAIFALFLMSSIVDIVLGIVDTISKVDTKFVKFCSVSGIGCADSVGSLCVVVSIGGVQSGTVVFVFAVINFCLVV